MNDTLSGPGGNWLGDASFTRLDERGDPAALPPGSLHRALNCRLVDGVAQTRGGFPILRCGPGTGLTPFTSPQLIQSVKDPVASTGSPVRGWLVIANGAAWFTSAGRAAISIPLPTGETLDNATCIIQWAGVILCGRGFDEVPLMCKSFSRGFETVTDRTSGSGNGTGTLTIPNFTYACIIRNRAVLVGGDGQLYISDALNFTRYAAPSAFYISPGTNDALVRPFRFNQDTLVAFKESSVSFLTGLDPDANGDVTEAREEPLDDSHGLSSPLAVAQYGNDVFYEGPGGLTTVTRTAQNFMRSADVPMSEPLYKTARRINWAARDQFCLGIDPSTSWLYRGMALDSSATCNAIAVLDLKTREWMSVDETSGVTCPVGFATGPVGGQDRLVMLDTAGYIRLCDEGHHDTIPATRQPFADIEIWTLPEGSALHNTDDVALLNTDGTALTNTGNGDSIQINGSAVLAVDATGAAVNWVATTLALARTNLAAYFAANVPSNCTVAATAYGVRITSTNGTAPVIVTTGACWRVNQQGATYFAPQGILFRAETRGYTMDWGRQQGQTLRLIGRSLDANYGGSEIGPGVFALANYATNQRPSYTTSTLANRSGTADTDRDSDNADGRWSQRGFQDYAPRLTATGIRMGGGGYFGLDRRQEFEHQLALTERGRFHRFSFASTRGAAQLIALGTELQSVDREKGVKR